MVGLALVFGVFNALGLLPGAGIPEGGSVFVSLWVLEDQVKAVVLACAGHSWVDHDHGWLGSGVSCDERGGR